MKLYFKIFLLLIVAFLIYVLMPLSSNRVVYIPNYKDKTFIDAFKYQDTPLNSFDTYILKLLKPKEGWIRLEHFNKFNLFKKALDNKREKTRYMVMFSGETIENFVKSIAKQANLNKEKILNIYHKLSPYKEGGILAQKYKIPFKTNEYNTIAYMIYKSESYFKKLANKENIKYPSNEFKKALTIASLISKETSDYKEMPLISAVIHNRLKQHIPLQIDASLNYGKNSHKIVTPNLIRKDNSKYNTYKYKGLPPSPISSVSKVALISAFMPSKVDYLYFVKTINGNHIFSSNYEQHLKNIKKYKNEHIKLKKAKIYKLAKSIKIKFPLLRYNVKVPRIKAKIKNNKVKKLKIYF